MAKITIEKIKRENLENVDNHDPETQAIAQMYADSLDEEEKNK